ncbi:MAG TPA: ABC transporter substrate-binding protein, partial [Phycisphaerae bacterium]|nr:ABC transporter substrate-binding protein [Phycisphaerae bacterium]
TRPAFDTSVSSREIDAEVNRRLKAKEPLYIIDREKIDQLKPDLLIAQQHCEVCAVTPGDVVRSGCAVVAAKVLALQAGSLSGIYQDVLNTADALGKPEAGRELVAAMQSRLSDIHSAVKNKPQPTVVVLEWTDPVFAMGNWGPELVEAANGELLLAHKGEHSRAIRWDLVRQADPEFLIVAPCGFNLARAKQEIAVLEKYPGLMELKAVQRGNLVFADGNLYFNRSGMTVVETAEILADILHATRLHKKSAENIWRRFPLSLRC